MEGGALFNPGFLGGNFLWWVGQITDDSYWRSNINPENYKSEKEIPGWGYRYKVRIIGLHDKEEETIKSEQLPWSQVMYPVTAGGGQGGSMQTPNIRQGMFVFGFFLDGADQQVPVIMGVLGNNTQTKLSSTIGVNSSNYAGTSGVANRTGSDGKGTGKSTPEVSDSNVSRNKPPAKTKPVEEAAGKNPAPIASQRQDEKLKEKITLSSPCKHQNTNLKNIQVAIEELSKKITQLTNALSIYSAAASSKISDIQKLIENIISEASDVVSKCLKGIFDQVEAFAQDLVNKALKAVENIAIPTSKLKILLSKIRGFESLTCAFNKIGNGLLDLVKKFLNKQFGPQISFAKDKSNNSLITSQPFPSVGDSSQNSFTSPFNFPINEIPNQSEQQTFIPTPSCITESLVSEILSQNINIILSAIDDSIAPGYFETTNALSSYDENVSSVSSPSGNANNFNQDFIDKLNIASQTLGTSGNLNLENIVNSIASSIGLNGGNLQQAIKAFSSGDFTGGFLSLAEQAGIDPNIIRGATTLLTGGDIVGGLSSIASSFGVDPKLLGSLTKAIQSIQTGNLPTDILSGTFNPSSLIPGINMDIAQAMSFITSIIGFFGCDPEPLCPATDQYTLYNGGSTTSNAPSINNIAKNTETPANKSGSSGAGGGEDNRVGQQDPQSRNVVNAEGEIQRSNRNETAAERQAVRDTLQL
jgi:Gp5 N-terminal OB domain